MKTEETTTKAAGAALPSPKGHRGRNVRWALLLLAGAALSIAVIRHDFRPEPVKLEEQTLAVEALIAAGKGEEARAVTPDLLQRSPKPDDLRLRLGRAYLRHGDPGPATALLAVVEPRLIPEERLTIAEYFLVSGDPFSASKFFDAASKDLKPTPQLLARHAESLALSGQGERAADLFARSVSADPMVLRTRLNLATTLANLGRLDESRKQAEAVLKINPDNPKALELLTALKTAK